MGRDKDEQNKYNKNLFDKSKDKGKQKIQEKLPMHAKPNQVSYNCTKKGHVSNECPYCWRLIGDKFYLVAPDSNTAGSKKIWIPISCDFLSAVLPKV